MATCDRRAFLRQASIIAAGAGLPGRLLAQDTAGTPEQEIRVRVEAISDPLVGRTMAILKDRIEHRCAATVTEADADAHLILAVDRTLPTESFRIDEAGAAVRINGGSPQGLLYGVGKLLRTSRYDGAFSPSLWRGTSAPRGALRGMYFASHFHNWYHQASAAEISRYMEDLALWGANAFMVVVPMINLQGWNDPEAELAMAMVRQYAKTARELGLRFATGVTNAMFSGAPQGIRAERLPDPTGRRGNSGHPICPSNPDGHAYIMENTRQLYEKLSDVGLDIVVFWPYDEGGCNCEKCRPWGSNGYLKLSQDLARLGREYFPELKTVLSTWMFDTPPEGEWQGLTDALAKENGWLDYVLADAHEDFPRYPLDVTVPGNLPLLNFPEISMWGNWPWGGVGANPLPARFQRLWDQVKHVVSGGFPYSEGIYEDMNKAAVLQFYWDPSQSARATLEEYSAYEFGPEVAGDVFTLVGLLETAAGCSYQKQPVNAEGVQRAFDLAESMDTRLAGWAREGWRWELLRLRAVLDRERFIGGSLESPAAETAMRRLIEIYHCQMETDDPYHHRVRPPLRQAVSRAGER